MKNPRLSIFSRFKAGGGDLTGEAKRQRRIIAALAAGTSPPDRTRTGIAQRMAAAGNTTWKNIYSGIFRDLDEVLMPSHIVEEEGRLPLRRGPKALQEQGVPYYRLTREGMLVAAALSDTPDERTRLLEAFFADATSDEKKFEEILLALSESSPGFVAYVMQLYVKSFCDHMVENLLPFDVARLGKMQDKTLQMQKEFASAYAEMSGGKRDEAAGLLDEITTVRDDDSGSSKDQNGAGQKHAGIDTDSKDDSSSD